MPARRFYKRQFPVQNQNKQEKPDVRLWLTKREMRGIKQSEWFMLNPEHLVHLIKGSGSGA